MRLFQQGSFDGLDQTSRVTLTHIEELKGTIIGTSTNHIRLLLIESECAQRRHCLKALLRPVRVVQIPNIRLLRHARRSLLETHLGVGDTNARFALIRVPCDFGNRAFDLVGVLENHDSLG